MADAITHANFRTLQTSHSHVIFKYTVFWVRRNSFRKENTSIAGEEVADLPFAETFCLCANDTGRSTRKKRIDKELCVWLWPFTHL